jgi:peptidoglycan/xylan/chitin deacetylase (PgdA/CDA1 family)
MIVTLLRPMIAVAALATALLVSPPGVRAETVVSLTFDDGIASQFHQARPQLNAHGMLGTFYVNSGTVGTDPYFMSWAEVDALGAQRHEIASHTLDHVRLSTLSANQRRRQICDDATTLRSRGLQVVDFAYPFGAGSTDGAVRDALEDCGFASARAYGGLRGEDCSECPAAESIPPADAYRVRTGFESGPLTLDRLQDWVMDAEAEGGGWVPIVFHEIDEAAVDEHVSPSTFAAFLDWLQARVGAGTVVRTVRSVMGYPDPAPPVEEPVPVSAFGAPAPDRATVIARLLARRRQDVDRLRVSASMAEAGTLSAKGTVTLRRTRFHLRTVTAAAAPGKLVKLRLRLTQKGLRAVKRALRSKRRVRARITVTARDAAGNVASAKRTVRLRP